MVIVITAVDLREVMFFFFQGKICYTHSPPTCIHSAVIFPGSPDTGNRIGGNFPGARAERLKKDLWFEIHAVVFAQMLMIFGTGGDHLSAANESPL